MELVVDVRLDVEGVAPEVALRVLGGAARGRVQRLVHVAQEVHEAADPVRLLEAVQRGVRPGAPPGIKNT